MQLRSLRIMYLQSTMRPHDGARQIRRQEPLIDFWRCNVELMLRIYEGQFAATCRAPRRSGPEQ